MKTFADAVNAFNRQLRFSGNLPADVRIMNPYREDKKVLALSALFYDKFYSDNNRRHLILGINPGRFGAGITGIPFTDPKRLVDACQIPFDGPPAHEPSSVFIYEMITAFGGVRSFYDRFYINSVCPLGFTHVVGKDREVNYNYYDSEPLKTAMHGFIVKNIRQQIALGVATDICFCFGTGKNEQFLSRLNAEKKFFGKIIPLEHPRFIMQYKAKSKSFYVEKYLSAFRQVN